MIISHFSFIVISTFLFIYITTGIVSGIYGFLLSVAIAASYFVYYYCSTHKKTLYLYIGALLSGFLSFHFFRIKGYAFWPLNHPDNLTSYVWLLYWHMAFSASVLIPLFLCHLTFVRPTVSDLNIKPFTLNFFGLKRFNKYVYIFSVSSWVAAFGFIFYLTPAKPLMTTFLFICILKGFITAFTEEIVFRGFILSASTRFFGLPSGIILQSIIYSIFHCFLGPGNINKALFMASVFFIGIIFGCITHYNKSIGFSVMIHAAIDMVVECSNTL